MDVCRLQPVVGKSDTWTVSVKGHHEGNPHPGEKDAEIWIPEAQEFSNGYRTDEDGLILNNLVFFGLAKHEGHNHFDMYIVKVIYGGGGSPKTITFDAEHMGPDLPEPTTIFLFGIGMISLFGIRARREVTAI
ncbi:PEP-CTERM sorting domain-containing protein [Candidatus Nitrosacidococcus sp. I8]|uniref:PEP-CTERM sorting domain-containing protein n=1 Tax=Candidatus Nitrosacidococcus sp. I8 TaxID=2942908 RepID=UPI0022271BF3|nr:PEP-CTERM sorting domain-containing protein [Candidatus Nitrosacidococcus sp. I8]CAH9018692.1 hypothetical protein NURINAE_01076 [Candidatus Nitrosacidococcus sp. I8]